MEKIKEIWGKMNLSMKITFPMYIAMMINLPITMFGDSPKFYKLETLIMLIPFGIIYSQLKRKPEEYSEAEKKCLYKNRNRDRAYILFYMVCLELNLVLLKAYFEPAWLVMFFIAIIIVSTSWVWTKYCVLLYYITREDKLNKGE